MIDTARWHGNTGPEEFFALSAKREHAAHAMHAATHHTYMRKSSPEPHGVRQQQRYISMQQAATKQRASLFVVVVIRGSQPAVAAIQYCFVVILKQQQQQRQPQQRQPHTV